MRLDGPCFEEGNLNVFSCGRLDIVSAEGRSLNGDLKSTRQERGVKEQDLAHACYEFYFVVRTHAPFFDRIRAFLLHFSSAFVI